MSNNTKLGRTQARSRRGSVTERRAGRRPIGTKWISAFLALGIVVLAGGGIFAATRPTWHPSAAETMASAKRAAAQADSASAATHRAIAAPLATQSHVTLLGTGRALATMPLRTHGSSTQAHASSSITYTVKPGDTLSGIAEWFKLHGYGRLYNANQSVIGSNPNLIIPGERVTISHGAMSLHHSAGA